MINEAWDSFSKLIPQGAPEVQRIETRRAFYAGAWAVFNMLMRLDGGAEPTPADMRKLAGGAVVTHKHKRGKGGGG